MAITERNKQLRNAFEKLPPVESGWRANRYHLRCAVEHQDARMFMRWPIISATMAIAHNAPYIESEVRALLDSPFWGTRLNLCKSLPVGGNVPFGIYDATLLHQAYHLWQFQQITGRDLLDMNGIVEVGAGYGAMAVLLHGMGYRSKYTIIDLPECCLLQEFYLSSVLGNVPVVWQDTTKQADMIVACYSLSEMSPELRKPILSVPYSAYLIAFQGWWAESGWECDNLEWFQQNLMQKRGDVYWTIKGNENQPGHYYLIGVEK